MFSILFITIKPISPQILIIVVVQTFYFWILLFLDLHNTVFLVYYSISLKYFEYKMIILQ